MRPTLAIDDSANDGLTDAKASSHLALRFDSGASSDFAHNGGSHLRAGVSLTNTGKSRANRMLNVARACHPFEIAAHVIRLAAILVVDLVIWRWWRADEGRSDQNVNGVLPALARLLRQVHDAVAGWRYGRVQQRECLLDGMRAAIPAATQSAATTDLVKHFVANDGQPEFIYAVGFTGMGLSIERARLGAHDVSAPRTVEPLVGSRVFGTLVGHRGFLSGVTRAAVPAVRSLYFTTAVPRC